MHGQKVGSDPTFYFLDPSFLFPRRRSFFLQAFSESLHAPRGVNHFGFAGVKRMALGADFNFQLLSGGAGFYDVPAGAGNSRIRKIFRVNGWLHMPCHFT